MTTITVCYRAARPDEPTDLRHHVRTGQVLTVDALGLGRDCVLPVVRIATQAMRPLLDELDAAEAERHAANDRAGQAHAAHKAATGKPVRTAADDVNVGDVFTMGGSAFYVHGIELLAGGVRLLLSSDGSSGQVLRCDEYVDVLA